MYLQVTSPAEIRYSTARAEKTCAEIRYSTARAEKKQLVQPLAGLGLQVIFVVGSAFRRCLVFYFSAIEFFSICFQK
jgi:hypothetical protein